MTDSPVTWADLDAFTQGYVEAFFQSEDDRLKGQRDADDPDPGVSFDDLAPATLAAIMADCATVQTSPGPYAPTIEDGARFWMHRQSGAWVACPCTQHTFQPAAPYLGTDGKVHLA